MWPTLQHFARFLFRKKRRPTSRRPRVATFRPRLEALEDRTLLSNYTAGTVTELIGDINAANAAGGTNTITLTAAASSAYILDDTTGALPEITANDNLTINTIDGANRTIERSSSASAFGLFTVDSGASLTLQDLTLSGSIDASNATSLVFQGTVTLTPTSSVDATAVAFWQCSAQVAGSYSATNTLLYEANVTMTGAVAGLGGTALPQSLHDSYVAQGLMPATTPGGINLDQSTLDLTGATLAPGSTDLVGLSLNSSTLLAAADWTVSGPVILNGGLGAGSGTGSLTAAGGLDLSGPVSISGYTVIIPQGQTATASDVTELYNGSVLDNQGTLTLEGTGRYGATNIVYDGSNALLKNEGTIYTNLDSGISVPINSPGDIIANNGSLGLGSAAANDIFTSNSTFSGQIDATNATGGLYFEGQVTLTPTSSVDAAAVNFSYSNAQVAGSYSATSTVGGNVTFTGTVESLGALDVGGTVDLSAATLAPGSTDLPSLSITGGTLIASADWTVSGLFSSYGRLEAGNGGTGSLTAAGGADLYGSLEYLIGYTLVIPQGQTATANDIMHLYDGAVLDNQGTLTLQGTGSYGATNIVYDGSNALLKNEGTIYTNLNTGISVPINSPGDIIANNGSLGLGAFYGTFTTNSTFSGQIDASNATGGLYFEGQVTLTPTSSVDAAAVNFSYGNAQVAGSYSATSTDLYEANVTVTGTVESLGALTNGGILDLSAATLAPGSTDLPSLSNSGTLIATADWTVSGLVSIGGHLEAGDGGSGSLTAAGGAELYGGNYLIGYTLVIPQGQTATANDITHLYDGAVLDNQGTLTLEGTGAYGGTAIVYDGSNALLKNEGTIYTNLNTGINVPIDSPGDIIANSGSLGLGDVENVPPRSTTSTFSGHIDATNATGGLYFEGQVTLTPTSSVDAADLAFSRGPLILQIGGANPGTGFDQIQSSNTVALGIPFQVQLVNGFAPSLGETFVIINNEGSGGVDGTFAGLPEGAQFMVGGYQFQISYLGGSNNQDVVLKVIQVPATTTVLTSSVDPSTYGQGVTLTATVSANTPGAGTPTGSVDFYDTSTNTDLGSVALSGGVATLNISSLAAGSHAITATYSGDSNFLSSTSPPDTQTVNQRATSTALTFSAATGSTYGQGVTFTATVSANAPGAGTPTGSVDFFDTTTNTDLGSATLSGGVASLTTLALAQGSNVITATYSGDGNFLTSNTSLTQTVTRSIYILNSTAAGALTVSGNAQIKIPGSVVVDSSSSKALTESGNAKITAANIQVVGGAQKTGNATSSPITTGAASVADPLAALVAPTSGTFQGSVNLSQGSLTINPGVYTSISVSGNAKLTLNPGVYIIAGGGLSVTGNAILGGSGVVIYNTGSNFPNDTGTFGAITVSGNATVNLSAPTSGAYAGVVLFQSRDNNQTLSLSGNAVDGMTGTIYAPAALLSVSGSVNLDNPLVVNELTLSGNATSS